MTNVPGRFVYLKAVELGEVRKALGGAALPEQAHGWVGVRGYRSSLCGCSFCF